MRPRAPALSFVVAGRPVPKTRARRGAAGHWYTPARSAGYADRVANQAWATRNLYQDRWPLDTCYSVLIVAYVAGRYGMDTDNIGKQVLDACQGILWANDAQVRELVVRVEHTERHDQRLEVSVAMCGAEHPPASRHRAAPTAGGA